MEWAMVGALSELLGAIAVVLSLIYVAHQVRAGTQEQKRNRFAEISRAGTEFSYSLAHDAEFADIMYRGFRDRSQLTPVEIVRFNGGLFGVFRAWEALFHYQREGGVHEWGPDAFLATMRDIIGLPGVQAYWEDRAHWYTSEFAEEVAREMQQTSSRMLDSYGAPSKGV